MLDYLLLALSVCANVAYGSFYNRLGKTALKETKDAFRLNAWIDLGVAVLMLVYSLVTGCSASLFTILLGVFFGCATALSALCYLKALEHGPMSLTVLFVTASMVVPAFSGAIFWNEPVSLLKIIGTLLMVAAGFLAVEKQDGKASRRWAFFCIGAFAFTGAIGILQKVHQSSPYKPESAVFLLTAFLTAGMICAVLSAFPKKKGEPVRFLFPKATMLLLPVCSIGVTLNNVINLYLSGALPAMLFYPAANGGSTALSVLVALLIFREKLTVRKWASMIIAVFALALLIFF